MNQPNCAQYAWKFTLEVTGHDGESRPTSTRVELQGNWQEEDLTTGCFELLCIDLGVIVKMFLAAGKIVPPFDKSVALRGFDIGISD